MSTLVCGPAGSGKTATLLDLAREAASRCQPVFTSTAPYAVERLRGTLSDPRVRVCALHDLALEVVRGAEIVDDARAAELFEEAAQPLFDLSWTEFLHTDLDFEVPGLRAPERFVQAGFRLFCKLRDALITPEAFMESALRGATQFYAKPPNFSGADLLHYTKDVYRDSLAVEAPELSRQYKHEIDLAKILARLYRAYLDHPVRAGCLTVRDALAQAHDMLRADASIARALREKYPEAFVDDAQEITIGEVSFLQAIYGDGLDGVTLAIDRESTTTSFRGARPDRVTAIAAERIVLETQRRSPYAVDAAARHLLGLPPSSMISAGDDVALALFRATTQRAEAQFIADRVVQLTSNGAPLDEIALIFRSVQSVHEYRDALLQRGIPVQIAGDVNVYADGCALDALAILWFVHDPYRHDYLLRVLQGPLIGLSDASVQTLCADPPDAQAPLLNDVAAPESRSSRWDARRDVRLALSALRGDRDDALSADARERLTTLRALRARWLDGLRVRSLVQIVRDVWSTGLAADPRPGYREYQQQTLQRLLRRIESFAQQPASSLADLLEYAERRMNNSFESSEYEERANAVRLLSVDAARGRSFDHVLIPNVRAGAFPRWYVPDAFLYSPSLGMIAKENVGDAAAARTAKFTYYMWRTKAREAYNEEERRAFVYAMRRARRSVVVTASGRPTRGAAAPEFLAELQAARLPGVQDLSDRWQPAKTMYRA